MAKSWATIFKTFLLMTCLFRLSQPQTFASLSQLFCGNGDNLSCEGDPVGFACFSRDLELCDPYFICYQPDLCGE